MADVKEIELQHVTQIFPSRAGKVLAVNDVSFHLRSEPARLVSLVGASGSGKSTTGKKADPRSFCIQKTLQEISHSDRTDDQLMFAGHNAYRFASDPFYANGFIPSVKQLVERLKTGY